MGIIIGLISAFIFFTLYSNPKAIFSYKKRWAIVACWFMVIYSLFGLTKSYQTFVKMHFPTKAEIDRAITYNGKIVKKEMLYKSPDGYTVLIPEGYAYSTHPSGAMSLVARKGDSIIVVMMFPSTDTLEKLMQDSCNHLNKKGQTRSFSKPLPVKINDNNGLRIDIEAKKQNMRIHSICLFFKKGNMAYQLQLICPQELFTTIKEEYEKVINSFT